MNNPLHRVSELGQAVWLDFISRPFVREGELLRYIQEDGLKGVTSNPTIFQKALAEGDAYDEDIRELSAHESDPEEVFTRLAIKDIQDAADVFRPLYDESVGLHGYVSLEVSPALAYDTQASIEMGRRLWREVDRPNVMIKIPGTADGLEAIRTLLSEGVNVNVTLLFGLGRYREVTRAFIDGLEARLNASNPATRIASVASFFLSRIDTMVDARLDRLAEAGGDRAKLARDLRGKAAIASARLAYQIYKEVFGGPEFEKLDHFGATQQRVLWASTSSKDPAYPDIYYVEALIGPETINTLPEDTLRAYRDHGRPELRLEQELEESRDVLEKLRELDIDIDDITARLEREGVDKFQKSYDSLLGTVRDKVNAIHA